MDKARIDMEKKTHQVSANAQDEKKYYAYIDGEEVEVDVKSDEEYACLMNCLESYYMFGGDEEEDEEEFDEDEDDGEEVDD